ncbi:MAG: hypothetical protein H6739_11830 [Alphaproteobacteria bacterium]|nr:hypothetical protein [Alphaproteobacteria bacterium]
MDSSIPHDVSELPPMRADVDLYQQPGGADFSALLRAVQEDEARPLRGRLRRLSTLQRQLFATALVTVTGLAVALYMGLRTDFVEHGPRLAVSFSAMVGLTFLSVRMSLRDLAAAPPGWRAWSLGAVGLAALLSMPLLSTWLPGQALALGPFWTLRCFRFTLLIGGVAVAAMLTLQRPGLSAPWRALNAGVAGALISAFFLMLHCDVVDAPHLWSGHTMPGVLVVAVALLAGAVVRRLRR